jgi:hypothetical protein
MKAQAKPLMKVAGELCMIMSTVSLNDEWKCTRDMFSNTEHLMPKIHCNCSFNGLYAPPMQAPEYARNAGE